MVTTSSMKPEEQKFTHAHEFIKMVSTEPKPALDYLFK